MLSIVLVCRANAVGSVSVADLQRFTGSWNMTRVESSDGSLIWDCQGHYKRMRTYIKAEGGGLSLIYSPENLPANEFRRSTNFSNINQGDTQSGVFHNDETVFYGNKITRNYNIGRREVGKFELTMINDNNLSYCRESVSRVRSRTSRSHGCCYFVRH